MFYVLCVFFCTFNAFVLFLIFCLFFCLLFCCRIFFLEGLVCVTAPPPLNIVASSASSTSGCLPLPSTVVQSAGSSSLDHTWTRAFFSWKRAVSSGHPGGGRIGAGRRKQSWCLTSLHGGQTLAQTAHTLALVHFPHRKKKRAHRRKGGGASRRCTSWATSEMAAGRCPPPACPCQPVCAREARSVPCLLGFPPRMAPSRGNPVGGGQEPSEVSFQSAIADRVGLPTPTDADSGGSSPRRALFPLPPPKGAWTKCEVLGAFGQMGSPVHCIFR